MPKRSAHHSEGREVIHRARVNARREDMEVGYTGCPWGAHTAASEALLRAHNDAAHRFVELDHVALNLTLKSEVDRLRGALHGFASPSGIRPDATPRTHSIGFVAELT